MFRGVIRGVVRSAIRGAIRGAIQGAIRGAVRGAGRQGAGRPARPSAPASQGRGAHSPPAFPPDDKEDCSLSLHTAVTGPSCPIPTGRDYILTAIAPSQ